MPTRTAVEEFTDRIHAQWLPEYCADVNRNYSLDGFKNSSIRLTEIDAADCLRAISHEVVIDEGGGRYVAPRSAAREVMFWEGLKATSPRPITLWIEPVITMAAAARLHLNHGWPKDVIGLQSKRWGFDFVAYQSAKSDVLLIAGEVKKTERELTKLVSELRFLSHTACYGDAETPQVSQNTRNKWNEILISQPCVFWALGPGAKGYVFEISYPSQGVAAFSETNVTSLNCANAA